jgi:Spy/CpxP family protein refolding chaperone
MRKTMQNKTRMLRSVSVALLGAAILCSTGFSQPKRMVPAERAERLKNELGLTDAQVAAVTKIFEESQQEMQKPSVNGGDDRQARRTAMKAMMDKTDSRIDSILTPDQKKKFASAKKKHQGKMPGRSRED